MYRLAIFDFDGTLVDSAPGIVEVMHEIVAEYKFAPETTETWKHMVGIPLVKQLQMLFPEQSDDFHQEVVLRYRQIYDVKTIEICPLFPGLVSMLESLRNAGILISIATSKRRNIVEQVLHHHSLFDYFSLVVGVQDVGNHKPHPESVEITLKRLGVSLADAVVIGDSTFDLEMARNAGVDAIGVTTGIHTAKHLGAAGPKYIVSSLVEVTPLILNGRANEN
ncbi:MAG: HAD family hydrolase [Candidatus Obscuribacterales bacterium]|nr:HAD family hydrolase [Candidatus Obscuribacterales bacterium]